MYDTEDQLRAVVNEQQEHYSFNFDTQGTVIEEIGFGRLSHKYRRNLGGAGKDFVGKKIIYEYDVIGRVTKVAV